MTELQEVSQEAILAYLSSESLYKRQRMNAVADCAHQRGQFEEDLFLLQDAHMEAPIPLVCLKSNKVVS